MQPQEYKEFLDYTVRPTTLAILTALLVGQGYAGKPRPGRFAGFKIEAVTLGDIASITTYRDGIRVYANATLSTRFWEFDIDGAPSELRQMFHDVSLRLYDDGRPALLEKLEFLSEV